MSKPNEMIREQRKRLELTCSQAAANTGMTAEAWADLERHSDEIASVPSLGLVRTICGFLQIEPFDLLIGSCVFCSGGIDYLDWYKEAPHRIFQLARAKQGVSEEVVAHRAEVSVEGIKELEQGSAVIDAWTFLDVADFARAYGIPVQIAAGAKCPRCGR